MFLLQASLLLGTITCTPPLLPYPTEPPEKVEGPMKMTSSVNQTTHLTTPILPSVEMIPLQAKKEEKFSANFDLASDQL